MKKIIIIILVILFALIAAGACVFGIWSYRNLNWYKGYDKTLKKLGAVEKRFTLPDGSERNIILIKKISQTSAKYPRPAAKIAKKSL